MRHNGDPSQADQSQATAPPVDSLSLRWAMLLSSIGCICVCVSWGLIALTETVAQSAPAAVNPMLFVALTCGFLSSFCVLGLLFTLNGWSHSPVALRNRSLLLGLAGAIWLFARFLPRVLAN